MEKVTCAYCDKEITRFDEWVEREGEYYHIKCALRIPQGPRPYHHRDAVETSPGSPEFGPTRGRLTH